MGGGKSKETLCSALVVVSSCEPSIQFLTFTHNCKTRREIDSILMQSELSSVDVAAKFRQQRSEFDDGSMDKPIGSAVQEIKIDRKMKSCFPNPSCSSLSWNWNSMGDSSSEGKYKGCDKGHSF